eukprot:gene4855-5492_t
MAAGKVQTVCGFISPDQLGKTLTHEHIRLRYLCCFLDPETEADKKRARDEEFRLDNLGWIRQNPYSHLGNLKLGEEDAQSMIAEVGYFKENGGMSMVEATTIGIYPDWEFLKQVSENTGVHIIAGAGHYMGYTLPEYAQNASIEELCKEIVNDVTVGRNGIKAGVIGEIGCTHPLTELERRLVTAAAKAQKITGAPLLIHPGKHHESPLEIINIIKESGGDVTRTVMSHLDRTIYEYDGLVELAKTGCILEHDFFGIEVSHYQNNESVDFLSDAQRIYRIKHLIDKGFEDNLVIAHDVHTRHRLVKYGGHGYSHILLNTVPKMLKRGITQEQVDKILIHTPKRWLTFV